MTQAGSDLIQLPKSFLTGNPFYVLAKIAPEIFRADAGELRDQSDKIKLIASENYSTPAQMAATGSVLTNKYAEGYPGKRYYDGCEWVDVGEAAAIQWGKALFGADHMNAQPHSGTTANQAAYFAILEPGDKILSMGLDQGGHLSHGAPVNAVGNIYDIVNYHVDRTTGLIDYDEVERLAKAEKPQLIIAGGSAYPRIIDFQRFRDIADEVGAYFMVDMAHFSGLVAAGDEVHPSPINIADIVTSTTQKTLGGPRGGMILLGKNYEMEVPHPNRERDDYVPLHEAIDFAVFPGMQGGPLEHVIAAKAVAFREALNAEMTGPGQAFIDRQQLTLDSAKVWEKFFTDEGYDLVSGGTDTHLILLREPRGLSGIRASRAAGLVNMVTNRNSVPYDKRPPAVTSGLRIGTGAIAAREFTPDEALVVAETLDEVLTNVKFDGRTPLISDDIVERGLATVQGLCDDHIIYADELEVMKWVARELNINLN